MRAAQILQSFPPDPNFGGNKYTYIQEREKRIIECVRAGHVRPLEWAEVRTEYKGHRGVLRVTADVVAIGDEHDWKRICTSHTLAQMIADVFDARLCTTRIARLIHEQATVKLRPCTQSDYARMSYTAAMLKHNDAIEVLRAGRTGLISNLGKYWTWTNRLQGRPQLAANYGWFDSSLPNGMWQLLQIGHNRWHVDYSQLLRLLYPYMLVDGVEMEVDDVAANPELCGLISDEGVMRIFRHPGVPLEQQTVELPSPDQLVIAENFGRTIEFVQAKNYYQGRHGSVELVVVHTMEAPEKPYTAESVAAWFSGKNAPQASAHYCVDEDSVVQCVREEDTAWHAPGTNHNGVGIEHAGYARQSPAEWADTASIAILERSARLVAGICKRWSLPVQYVSADGLKAGQRGITTHHNATLAFRRSSHTDPGKNFPMDRYLDLIRKNM